MSKIIIANWKMKLDPNQSVDLAKEIHLALEKNQPQDKEVVLCPSFLALSDVSKVLKDSLIALGAQDTFYASQGAYTGEVSVGNLKTLGCKYVIVGHSERRAMGETDELVNKKVKAVLEQSMTPIICIGEVLEQREAGQSDEIILEQLNNALAGIKTTDEIIVAYEPVWSISTSGSGKVIDSKEAAREMKFITDNLPPGLNIKVIYGGSVTADTVAEFMNEYNFGALVGGASLEVNSFVDLIKNS